MAGHGVRFSSTVVLPAPFGPVSAIRPASKSSKSIPRSSMPRPFQTPIAPRRRKALDAPPPRLRYRAVLARGGFQGVDHLVNVGSLEGRTGGVRPLLHLIGPGGGGRHVLDAHALARFALDGHPHAVGAGHLVLIGEERYRLRRFIVSGQSAGTLIDCPHVIAIRRGKVVDDGTRMSHGHPSLMLDARGVAVGHRLRSMSPAKAVQAPPPRACSSRHALPNRPGYADPAVDDDSVLS